MNYKMLSNSNKDSTDNLEESIFTYEITQPKIPVFIFNHYSSILLDDRGGGVVRWGGSNAACPPISPARVGADRQRG